MVEKSINVTEMSLCAVQYVTVNDISLSVRCSLVIYDRIDIWIVLDVTVQHFHSTCSVWGGYAPRGHDCGEDPRLVQRVEFEIADPVTATKKPRRE